MSYPPGPDISTLVYPQFSIIVGLFPRLIDHQFIHGRFLSVSQRTHSQTVPFTILSMSANPIEEDLIAVSGLKECHVLSLTPTGAVANTTILQPALDMGMSCLFRR